MKQFLSFLAIGAVSAILSPICVGPFLIQGCTPAADKPGPAGAGTLDTSESVSIAVKEMTKRRIEFREEDIIFDENNQIFDRKLTEWLRSPLLAERYGYLRNRNYQAILIPSGDWRSHLGAVYVVLIDRLSGDVIDVIKD